MTKQKHKLPILIVSSKQTVAPCPVCTFPTHRIHSHYERRLADLSWAEYRVSWQLQVRKYFCLNQQCQRRIFTEPLPGIVAPWARRKQRLAVQLSAIGLAVGGALGVKLSHRLELITSRNTLLSSARALPLRSVVTPRILGVDDFAFRKRQIYGTILVDLECHQPVTLLSDRGAETLAEWLQEHPGVEVVSRDHSKAYAKAITKEAPSAIQVADPLKDRSTV